MSIQIDEQRVRLPFGNDGCLVGVAESRRELGSPTELEGSLDPESRHEAVTEFDGIR